MADRLEAIRRNHSGRYPSTCAYMANDFEHNEVLFLLEQLDDANDERARFKNTLQRVIHQELRRLPCEKVHPQYDIYHPDGHANPLWTLIMNTLEPQGAVVDWEADMDPTREQAIAVQDNA